jgi:CubicO group peptidase (beta-lactamase class C family)
MNNLRTIKKALVFSMTTMLTLVILLSIAGSAMAQENRVAPGSIAAPLPSQQGPTDPTELESFLDELLKRQMEEYHIAGAAVSVVKDGKLFFSKGYGYADLENGFPVDPQHTIFAIGSVGKLFTWTAVMQLAEQGKLDLDADINTYLDFRIPDTYPKPITLKHLLTHTSGFENRLLGSAVSSANDLVPAREWLVSQMHARVRPPGEVNGYSNYNAMLAGYIVAQVSGQPYDQYIQEHILNPLAMGHTTAQSPLPTDLRPFASEGYTYENGEFQAFPKSIAQPAGLPSGTHRGSVTDIARFMIAHLQNGRYSDADLPEVRILKETTAQLMHSTLYTPDPRLLGTAYGFSDFSDNGQRTLGHSGEYPPFNSLLLLLPDQNLGVFVAYNSQGGAELTNQHLGFQRAFFDHYYPAPAVPSIQSPPGFVERDSRLKGSYRWTMGSKTTLMKIMGLFGTVTISDPEDGTLLLTTPFGEWRFVAVEPLYFRQADGQFGIVFLEGDQGQITYMYTDLMPQFAFEKLYWYETLAFELMLVIGCILIFLFTIPVILIHIIRDRRWSGNGKHTPPHIAYVAFWIILAVCVLNLLFLVGFVGSAMGVMKNMLLGPPLILKIVLGLGVVSALLTAGSLVYTVLAWKNCYWGTTTRLYYTMVTVAAAAFIWLLNYWNLLGWRF